MFQDHHQLEVIAPSSFYPPSLYPSKLFVSFLIYIMSCSLLTTPFIRFPSTLSLPANIDITTTSCLYLIQQQVKKLLVFDTVTSITWASTQFAQLRNLCLQRRWFVFRISSAFTPLIRFQVLFHHPPISTSPWPIACIWYSNLQQPTVACIWYSNFHNLGFYSVCPALESPPAASSICVSHFLCLSSAS